MVEKSDENLNYLALAAIRTYKIEIKSSRITEWWKSAFTLVPKATFGYCSLALRFH
jgi:hypothetical protein